MSFYSTLKFVFWVIRTYWSCIKIILLANSALWFLTITATYRPKKIGISVELMLWGFIVKLLVFCFLFFFGFSTCDKNMFREFYASKRCIHHWNRIDLDFMSFISSKYCRVESHDTKKQTDDDRFFPTHPRLNTVDSNNLDSCIQVFHDLFEIWVLIIIRFILI